ncbi:MAG: serine/threonine protein kinase [Myxococcaceae bacterium]|nr:serine/threonine protein kinase [Myxococcaceae bacterium]
MASQPQNGAQPRFLGRYELMYLLGQGGMGEVHLARLTGAAGFEKLCIVKTILPQMMTDPQFVDRFHHEAKVLTHLTHSNIAQVYDMGDVDQTLYMAIEYVAGVDLSRVEDRVKGMSAVVPVPIAMLIGQQITEALGYAHRKVGADGVALGIVHRDVSPQNVMVSYEGEVKVIDFGLAKSTARSKHTMPSTVLGKLGYMSPEQAKGETVDHRSDIYSAGIVIWELLAGRPLFLGGTVGEMVAQMAFPKPVSLRAIRPEISETLDRTVMRALGADPATRYNRADDFSRALNELLVRENLSVSAEDVGNYVRSMCPEEFAAERHLQSKLSAERKKGSSPKVPSRPAEVQAALDAVAATATNAAHKLDGTMVRTGPNAMDADQMTGPQRALSGQISPAPGRGAAPARRPPSSPIQQPRESFVNPADDELKIQKSRAPLIVVLLLLLIAGGAGGTWWFVIRPAEGGGAVVVADPPKPVEPNEIIVARVGDKPVEPAPVKVAEVKAADPVAEDPKPVEVPVKEDPAAKVDKPLERARFEGEALVIFRDKGELWVKPGKKTKVKLGDELTVVGPPIPNSPLREVYGLGAIMEMKGLIGRVDEGVQVPGKAVVFAVIEKGGKRKPVGPVAAANPTTAKTEPAKADPARTEVKPDGTKVAVKAADPKPVEATPVKAEEVAVPARPAALVLKGRVINEGGRRGVILYNDTNFKWNTCEVRLPFKKFFKFEDPIGPMDSDNIRHGNFEDDPREPDQHMKAGWAMVRCKEASGYLWWGSKQEL